MNNVLRTISGIVAFCVTLSCISNCPADFSLTIDYSSVRITGSHFEIDGFFGNSGVNSPAKIQQLFVSLRVAPANGYSAEQINGVQFLGLANPATDPLFASPMISGTQFFNGNQFMAGSLRNPIDITPQDGKRAFTVLLQSTLSNPVDVKIDFAFAGYVDIFAGDLVAPVEILNRYSNGSFTISAVPSLARFC